MENFIHPTALVAPKALLGTGNHIGPYCVVYENVIIGNDNHFQSHVSIGSPAEHKDPNFDPRHADQEDSFVYIGNGNMVREFVTINKPTTSKRTQIGNNCYIMKSSHISHDTVIEDDVIMSCGVITGGHSYVMKGAYLAIYSVTHPYTIVGSYSMLGMCACANKTSKIEPGKIYIGNPLEYLKDNTVGLQRNNVDSEMLSKEIDRYRHLLGYL